MSQDDQCEIGSWKSCHCLLDQIPGLSAAFIILHTLGVNADAWELTCIVTIQEVDTRLHTYQLDNAGRKKIFQMPPINSGGNYVLIAPIFVHDNKWIQHVNLVHDV